MLISICSSAAQRGLRVGRIHSHTGEKPQAAAGVRKLSLLGVTAARQDAIFITVSEARDN